MCFDTRVMDHDAAQQHSIPDMFHQTLRFGVGRRPMGLHFCSKDLERHLGAGKDCSKV